MVARNTALQLLRVLLSNQRLKSISDRIGKACLFRACCLRHTIKGADGPTITSYTFFNQILLHIGLGSLFLYFISWYQVTLSFSQIITLFV